MLNIVIKDGPHTMDIEEEFAKYPGISDTPLNRLLLKEIEQSQYLDENYVFDRFGAKLRIEDISTGCKAALLVAQNPDTEIDLIEVGINARDTIIKNCKNGKIRLHSVIFSVAGEATDKIDVVLDGNHYTILEDLNLYLDEEYT